MTLRFLEEWDYHKIASATLIPIGTLEWRAFNAKKKLAPHLAGGRVSNAQGCIGLPPRSGEWKEAECSGYLYCRSILSLRILDCSVVRFIPRRAAAPSGPPT